MDRCVNSHGDFGLCSTHEACEDSDGLHIGHCSLAGIPGAGSCCYQLRCRPTSIQQDMTLRFNHFGLRNAPAHMVSRAALRQLGSDPMHQICGRPPAIFRRGHILSQISTEKRYPWLLSLWIKPRGSKDDDGVPICGAALITTLHAITAAHCIVEDHFEYFIQGGTNWNWIGFGTKIQLAAINIHPGFEQVTFEHDIAILRFKERLILTSSIFPVCLPPPVSVITDYSGQSVVIAGWGCIEEDCKDDDRPILLRDTVLPIIDNDLAMCLFMNDSIETGSPEYIPKETFIVVGDDSGSSATCSGDSGSPAVRDRGGQMEVVGLVSWSRGCGRKFRPSVLTRVESYSAWVLDNLDRS